MVTRLSTGLWHVDCRTLDKPNVFVVDDGDCTLVDAGWPGDEATVREGVREAGFDLGDIDRVLLTHYDADHVGTLAKLTPDLDAPVYVHEMDAPYVAGESLPPWTVRNGLGALHRLYYRRLDLPDLPVSRIRDGERLGGFRAYHTPGHTPGHTVYVHEDLGVAFLGDLAWERGGQLRPSGRFTSHDRSRVQGSIRTLIDRTSDVDHVCPGHGRPLMNGYEHLVEITD